MRKVQNVKKQPTRQTIDLSAYPDLVVIYLGMQVRKLKGLVTLLSFGLKITQAVAAQPDGLLLHENLIYSAHEPWLGGYLYSWLPLHFGMRQYWRDFESLETWSHSLPHKDWWLKIIRDTGGTGFWHETYSMRGGMEAAYLDMEPVGLMRFATVQPARHTMFSARKRLGLDGEPRVAAPISEQELYTHTKVDSAG